MGGVVGFFWNFALEFFQGSQGEGFIWGIFHQRDLNQMSAHPEGCRLDPRILMLLWIQGMPGWGTQGSALVGSVGIGHGMMILEFFSSLSDPRILLFSAVTWIVE